MFSSFEWDSPDALPTQEYLDVFEAVEIIGVGTDEVAALYGISEEDVINACLVIQVLMDEMDEDDALEKSYREQLLADTEEVPYEDYDDCLWADDLDDDYAKYKARG